MCVLKYMGMDSRKAEAKNVVHYESQILILKFHCLIFAP